MDKVIVIKEEIEVKGKCYIICNDLDNKTQKQFFDDILDKEYKTDQIKYYICCKDEVFDDHQEEIELENFTLSFYTDMIQMKKMIKKEVSNLTIKPLEETHITDYMKEHNQSFFHIPCSATYGEEILREKIEDELEDVGLIYDQGKYIGTYEINYKDNEAEIEGLSINVDNQNKGYGKKALEALENYLTEKGYNQVKLTVASINTIAYELYIKSGYEIDFKRSRWYKVNKK